MTDFRIVTGPCLLIIGALFVTIAMRLWYLHPINRVFRIGRFVTEEGLRAILGLRPLIFALGWYFLTAGMSRIAFWAWRAGYWNRSIALACGTAEALFAVASTVLIVKRAWGLWR